VGADGSAVAEHYQLIDGLRSMACAMAWRTSLLSKGFTLLLVDMITSEVEAPDSTLNFLSREMPHRDSGARIQPRTSTSPAFRAATWAAGVLDEPVGHLVQVGQLRVSSISRCGPFPRYRHRFTQRT